MTQFSTHWALAALSLSYHSRLGQAGSPGEYQSDNREVPKSGEEQQPPKKVVSVSLRGTIYRERVWWESPFPGGSKRLEARS